MRRICEKLWFWCVINVAVFALLSFICPLHYEENDDIAMCMIANGVLSGSPDCHLVFINAVWGYLLQTLYRFTISVEWYTLLLALLHIFSFSFLTCLVVREHKPRYVTLIFLLLLYAFWARIIVCFQFTTTAGLLCAAGCYGLIQKDKSSLIIGAILVILASMIRFHAAALVGIVLAPFMIYSAFKNKKLWIIFFSLLCGVFLLHYADNLFYSSSDWAYYKSWNALRGSLNDNPNAFSLTEMPDNINEHDWELLLRFMPDSKVLTMEKMQTLHNVVYAKMHIRSFDWYNLRQLTHYRLLLCLICLGMGILCLLMDTKQMIMLVASLGIIFACLIYIALTGTLKTRVFLCVLIASFILLYTNIPASLSGNLNTMLKIVGLMVVFVVLISKLATQTYAFSRRTKSTLVDFEKHYSLLKSSVTKTDSAYFYMHGLPWEYLSPWHIKDFPYRCVGLGWITTIPFQKDILEGHDDFVRNRIIIFCHNDDMSINELQQSIYRNYNIMSHPHDLIQYDNYKITILQHVASYH